MDVGAVRQAVADAVGAAVSGLRTSAVALDNPTPPMAIVWPASGPFLTFDTQTDQPDHLILTVTILVAKASDRGGQAALDGFLAGDSAWSALSVDPTLDGLVSSAQFVLAQNYGLVQWAGIDYYGVELVTDVMAAL